MYELLADIKELEFLKKIVDKFLSSYSDENKNNLKLAIVEIFTNIIKHAKFDDKKVLFDIYEREAEIFFYFEYEDKKFKQPKDKFKTGTQVGGLGLYIVKRIIDELKYEYDNENKKVKVYGKKVIS
jgi:anti-sigma regulatory factor (Ser/Thr protein kinase)